MVREVKVVQPSNPTDEERHMMLRLALAEANRIEDYDNLIELLSPPKDITTILSPGKCKGINIGIIGGGIAGLSTAFELRKLGFDITIFEQQKERIGGRIYTYYFDENKRFYGEIGAMRIPVSHEATWNYINLFNLETTPFIQNNDNALIYVRNKRAINDPDGISVMEKIYPEFNLAPWERREPWQKLVSYGLGASLLEISPDIRRELLQNKMKYSPEIEYFDSISIRRELEERGLSKGAIELISCIATYPGWLYDNSYIESLQEQYAVDDAFRYQIDGGMVNLPLAMYRSLMSLNPREYKNISENQLGKITWNSGNRVKGIYRNNEDNKVILEYSGEGETNSSHQSFDFVVCAIPFSSLRNVTVYPMFSTSKMQAIKEVNYIAGQKTIFMCKERFWEEGGPSKAIIGGGSYTDLPIGSIWYPSYNINYNITNLENQVLPIVRRKYKNYEDGGVLMASYNLTRDAVRLGNLEPITRLESIKRQVEHVQGLKKGYLDDIVLENKTIQWDNEQGFFGAVCYYMPGQKRLFAYTSSKPEYDNRVYFAGEHISQEHGWIQGAVKSAMIAANDIAEHCKIRLKQV
ncbi:FAD-dependent oxidoreductase [Clostridium subterminale]|uniref:FAD-dependent oxidoreductase n=2 Tax=Clostridium subterminale TaxID=1550 RepID=A0ABP3W4A3_CLOSU